MNYFEKIIEIYIKRMDEIKFHIDFISSQKDLYKKIKDNQSMNSYADKLKNIINSNVQYNSIIISLYGCFEEFIDEIALEYISIIEKLCTSYNDLPKKIQEKHLYKVGEFLSNPQRYQGYNLTVDVCIKNMYNSIYSFEERKLNSKLIISHSGNLKIDKIYELFSDLGISNLKNKFEVKNLDLGLDLDLNLLDELVEQRNIISHSWSVDQRFSLDKIKNEILTLLINIEKILKNILLDEIFLFMYENKKFIDFDEPIQVINNKILCINSKSSYLEKGDSIFLCKNNNAKLRLEILNIQIDNTNVNKIENENINVGLEVNKNIVKNGKYYYINKNN